MSALADRTIRYEVKRRQSLSVFDELEAVSDLHLYAHVKEMMNSSTD